MPHLWCSPRKDFVSSVNSVFKKSLSDFATLRSNKKLHKIVPYRPLTSLKAKLTIRDLVTLHSKDWNTHRFSADVRYLSSARCCARCHRESVKGQKTKAKSWRLRVPDGKGANAERCNLNFSLFTFHSWLVLPSLCPRYLELGISDGTGGGWQRHKSDSVFEMMIQTGNSKYIKMRSVSRLELRIRMTW